MASNNLEVLDPEAPVETVTESKLGYELDRRHFLAALGVAGAAAGTALVAGKSALAQEPNPNGYAQVDVLNLLLNVKYLKATLYSYVTQGTDLPAASYVTVGTGVVFNAPAKVTFSSTQITDLFNEMYYDELNQLIALRNILGVAVASRQTMNLLGTGTTTTATTTLTQSQVIALARLLEDLSASAFVNATVYLTGTNLSYAAQAMATDAFHSGAVRLLAIQNNVQYEGTQFASVSTSNTAQAAVTFTGVTTAGSNIIYGTLGSNLPAVGNVVTGIGIPGGAGAVITQLVNTPSVTINATANSSTSLTNVSSVAGLLPSQPITGTYIPAGTYIAAGGVGTNTLTLSAATTGSNRAAPTGVVTLGSPTITGVSSTSGLIVGQVITGNGVPSGTTIAAFSSSAATITLSANATASSLVSLTGTVTSGSATISAISSASGLVTGQPIFGAGIPANATITSLTATSITMSAPAMSSSVGTVPFTGIVTSGSATITAISTSGGLAAGQLIAGPGIPTGTTISSIAGTTVTMSAKATASSTVTPGALTTSGSNTLTSVSSVAGLIVGQAITGSGIPSGATITAIGTNTITMSANATATITAAETVTSPTTTTVYAGGEAITSATTEAFSTPITEPMVVGLSQITLAGNATSTGFNTFYIAVADPQDVEPGDPGTAALSAAGPAAIPGTTISQGFFNTAGSSTPTAYQPGTITPLTPTPTPPAGFAFARTFQQVLAVLYGYNTTNSVISTQNYEGGFYPVGVSGNINSTI